MKNHQKLVNSFRGPETNANDKPACVTNLSLVTSENFDEVAEINAAVMLAVWLVDTTDTAGRSGRVSHEAVVTGREVQYPGDHSRGCPAWRTNLMDQHIVFRSYVWNASLLWPSSLPQAKRNPRRKSSLPIYRRMALASTRS